MTYARPTNAELDRDVRRLAKRIDDLEKIFSVLRDAIP